MNYSGLLINLNLIHDISPITNIRSSNDKTKMLKFLAILNNYFLFIKMGFVFIIFLMSLLMNRFVYAETVHLGLRINYQTAMSHVDKADSAIIESLYKLSDLLPNSKILISGHTDIVGSYQINMELSKGRATILKDLLVKRGVPADKIEAKWFSYDAPIASNETLDGRAKNRRSVASFYNLTVQEAKSLVKAVERSNNFYVIKVENEKVDLYVEENLKIEKKLEESHLALGEKVSSPDVVAIDNSVSFNKATIVKKDNHDKKIKLQNENHRYYLGLAFTDNKLTATRSGFKAVWITDFNYNLSAAYQYKMKNNLWVGGSGQYNFQDYKLEDNQIYNWDGLSPNLIRVSSNLDYQIENWNLGFDINYTQESFVISNGLDIFLMKDSLLGLSLRSQYRILNNPKSSSRLKFVIEYPLIGKENIDSKGTISFLIGADYSFKQLFEHSEINVGLVYGVRNFENQQNSQIENFVGLEFKLRNNRWF